MRLCAAGHEPIVHDGAVLGPRDNCPLCVTNLSLARALAEVSRLYALVEALQTRAVIPTGRIR